MEPLTLEYLAKIIRYERPDAIVPGIGGQTGLNLAIQLDKQGDTWTNAGWSCSEQTARIASKRAEDREKFKELCERLGEPVLPSVIAHTIEEGVAAAEKIGYPVVLRPGVHAQAARAAALPTTKKNSAKCMETRADALSRASGAGGKERQGVSKKSNTRSCATRTTRPSPSAIWKISTRSACIPGDSIVVCAQSDADQQRISHAARRRAENHPRAERSRAAATCSSRSIRSPSDYFLIEVNPRVSRSSALASKASGYPIARVSAKIAVGMTLDEIPPGEHARVHLNLHSTMW